MQQMTVQEIKLITAGLWARRANDGSGREAAESLRALRVTARSICTDTRQLLPGDLYLALNGARFDGATFLAKAEAAGAVALVTESLPVGFTPRVPTILVKDSLRAYGRIARACRDGLRACVVAITGTNGKTTTRELVAAVLKRRYQVLQNSANENNLIGVPRTLLRLSEHHDFAIIEMGTSEPGEIAALAELARPNCGVLTSISESHLSGLSDLGGVIKEKASLLEALPRDGIAIVNFDDPRCVRAAQRASCRVVSYGTDSRCELRADDIRVNRFGVNFLLNGMHDFRLPLHGRHNVSNALAAIAVGWVSGVEIREMAIALRRAPSVEHRLQYRDFNGVGVLDDSYNANPASTCAALRTLSDFPCAGQRIAVLGDMLELGEHSGRLHREVGWFGSEHAVDLVVAVGPEMRALADAYDEHFRETGHGAVWRYDDAADAAADLIREVRGGDLVLVKGSHGMKMSRVTNALRVRFAPGARPQPLRPTVREHAVGDPLPAVINRPADAA